MKQKKKRIIRRKRQKITHIKPLNILNKEEMDKIYGGDDMRFNCAPGNDTPGGSGGGGGGGGCAGCLINQTVCTTVCYGNAGQACSTTCNGWTHAVPCSACAGHVGP